MTLSPQSVLDLLAVLSDVGLKNAVRRRNGLPVESTEEGDNDAE